MRDQLAASGLTPSTYIGSNGLYGRADLAGLNLAEYPAVLIELGNMRNADDAARMSSPQGQAEYAAAVVRGIAAYLAWLTLDSPAAGDSRLAACSRSATSPG